MKFLKNPIEVADSVIKNRYGIFVHSGISISDNRSDVYIVSNIHHNTMKINLHLGVYSRNEIGFIILHQAFIIPSKEIFMVFTDYLLENNYTNHEDLKYAIEKYETYHGFIS